MVPVGWDCLSFRVGGEWLIIEYFIPAREKCPLLPSDAWVL